MIHSQTRHDSESQPLPSGRDPSESPQVGLRLTPPQRCAAVAATATAASPVLHCTLGRSTGAWLPAANFPQCRAGTTAPGAARRCLWAPRNYAASAPEHARPGRAGTRCCWVTCAPLQQPAGQAPFSSWRRAPTPRPGADAAVQGSSVCGRARAGLPCCLLRLGAVVGHSRRHSSPLCGAQQSMDWQSQQASVQHRWLPLQQSAARCPRRHSVPAHLLAGLLGGRRLLRLARGCALARRLRGGGVGVGGGGGGGGDRHVQTEERVARMLLRDAERGAMPGFKQTSSRLAASVDKAGHDRPAPALARTGGAGASCPSSSSLPVYPASPSRCSFFSTAPV